MDNNSLLRVRFVGDDLDNNSIPIYDLGNTLIAIQRIIHKAHMIYINNESKRPFLTFDERSELALQLSNRERGSDIYEFISFLNSNPILSAYVASTMTALSCYAAHKIINRSNKEDDQFKLNVFIFNQVKEIGTRVQLGDNIEKIEFTSPALGLNTPAVFDKNTKKYINTLKNQIAYGEVQSVTGAVIDILTTESAVKITRPKYGALKINLTDADFNQIRYSDIKKPIIEATGKPMFRLGVETYSYEAFKASSIKIIRD